MLIAMAGLPGTGKSTLAARLAAALGGVVLSKDTVRAALFPPPALDYSREQDDLTLAAIYAAARRILGTSNHPVIIDGRTFSQAYQIRDLFAAWPVDILDSAPAARPGLRSGPAADFVAAVGGEPRAKLGWTDVARFAELGIPAVNYGPGISEIAHTPGEYVEAAKIVAAEQALTRWLTA